MQEKIAVEIHKTLFCGRNAKIFFFHVLIPCVYIKFSLVHMFFDLVKFECFFMAVIKISTRVYTLHCLPFVTHQ